MPNPRLDLLTDYPFQRLRDLLDGIEPPAGLAPLVLSIGEPQHATPPMVAEILAREAGRWNKYPPVAGTPGFRNAVADWLTGRYGLPAGMLEADRHVLPLAGTREGLYMLAQVAVTEAQGGPPPVVLTPNPFYQVYSGAGLMAGAEVVFLPATRETGFLPDLAAIDPEVLRRAALFYLCSPGNPQGAVADLPYLERAIGLARRHGFVLALDECYAEIHDAAPPPGGLEACARLGGSMEGVLVFHSLSKRSSAAGLRSGFVAGDARLIALFTRLRSYAGATLPEPVLAASEALWRDQTHVEANRARYRAKFDIAERLLGGRFGFRRPAGGFFLWLDVGDGEAAARRLWEKAALRVLPGAYLARPDASGANPGAPFIRVALVHDEATVEEALSRLVKVL